MLLIPSALTDTNPNCRSAKRSQLLCGFSMERNGLAFGCHGHPTFAPKSGPVDVACFMLVHLLFSSEPKTNGSSIFLLQKKHVFSTKRPWFHVSPGRRFRRKCFAISFLKGFLSSYWLIPRNLYRHLDSLYCPHTAACAACTTRGPQTPRYRRQKAVLPGVRTCC